MKEKMNCNCLEEIRKSLLVKHKTKTVDFELRLTVDTASGDLAHTLPPLGYIYKVGRKFKKGIVRFNFCPFCKMPMN
jgi:hypothetical protein